MNKLKEIRARKRLTQFHLRLLTGISPSKISLAENEFIELREDEKAEIAKALGVKPDEIWEGGETHGREL